MGHEDFLGFIGFAAKERMQVEYLQPAPARAAE